MRRRAVGGEGAGHRRRYLFLGLSLAWMALIFWFSSKNGEASAAESVPLSELFHLPEWLIRKGAHMAEYAVLAAFLYGFFDSFPWKRGRAAVLAWLLSTAYAATDEFHQFFVAGRSASVKDVGIDSAGAFLGLAVILALSCAGKYLRQRRIKETDKRKNG